MLGITVAGLALWRRGRLYDARGFLRLCMLADPLGYVAVTAGWITTEVGRQPWVVYGHLRTADAVTPVLDRARRRDLAALYVVVYVAHLRRRAVLSGARWCAARTAGRRRARAGRGRVAAPARPLSAATARP